MYAMMYQSDVQVLEVASYMLLEIPSLWVQGKPCNI